MGIVLFHPPTAAQRLIESAGAQFDSVFLVDNTPGGTELPELRGGADRIMTNDTNRGLAVAINQLCSAAREDGFEWLLLFDQDSTLPTDFAARFRAVIETLKRAPAIIAANYLSWLGPDTLPGYTVSPAHVVSSAVTAINAGSLINLATHHAVGGHDESLFVDHVDHDYCLRLRKHGQQILVTQQTLFEHQIGQVITRRGFGRSWQSSGHSPARRQEWARGLVRLAKRYWRSDPRWCAQRVLIELPRHFLALLVLENQRWRKTLALGRGLLQGAFSSPQRSQPYN